MNPQTELTPSLSRTPGTSLHRQLFTVLRDQILRGNYQAGALLPKEEELCVQFGVSRITVRRALADLEQQGLVEKRQGRGTFVGQQLPPARPLATIGFLETMKQVSDETQVKVLRIERMKLSAEIAQPLNLTTSDAALHVVRLRSHGEVPVMITETWIPESLANGIDEQQLTEKALYQLLLQKGVSFGRVVQEITAIAATPPQARLLTCEIGQPLLRLTRLIYDEAEHPIQYLLVTLSPERSRLLMDFSINDMNTLRAGSIFHDVQR